MQLDISKSILDKNDTQADANRALLDANKVFVINMLASPGSGKTTTILSTIEALRDKYNFAVIEGDIASKIDAEKIKAAGVPCVQINTGGICHLESQMVAKALETLDLESIDVIFIENVGNLVCTTDFYLGENVRIVVLSVPEGHDKPVKYPSVFQIADSVVLSKIDTMPLFDFNEVEFYQTLSQINPTAPVFPISAKQGLGMTAWIAWISTKIEEFGGTL